MQVPHHHNAEVPHRKVVDYLLDQDHPDGGPKARFFADHGYTAARADVVIADLKRHISEHSVANTRTSRFGISYAVDGSIHAPDGQDIFIRTVWFIETGFNLPQFVTAYPVTPPHPEMD